MYIFLVIILMIFRLFDNLMLYTLFIELCLFYFVVSRVYLSIIEPLIFIRFKPSLDTLLQYSTTLSHIYLYFQMNL